MLTVQNALKDLEQYVAIRNLHLSKNAYEYFKHVEIVSKLNDNPPLDSTFLFSAIKVLPGLSIIVNTIGGNSEEACNILKKSIVDDRDDLDHYPNDDCPYSDLEYRHLSPRPMLLDACIEYTQLRGGHIITSQAIISSILKVHDDTFPVFDNGQWADERLHTPYNTLSHIWGKYTPVMWIKFSDIRTIYGFEEELAIPRLISKMPYANQMHLAGNDVA